MQSLELSCQEADFMLNDALNKIKRGAAAAAAAASASSSSTSLSQSPSQHPSLLLNHHHQNHHNSVNRRQQQSSSNENQPETIASTSDDNATTKSMPVSVIASSPTANSSTGFGTNNSSLTSTVENNNNTTGAVAGGGQNVAGEKRSDSNVIGSGGGSTGSGVSPAKKLKTTSSSNTGDHHSQHTTSSSSTAGGNDNPTSGTESSQSSSSTFFNIHEKLRELYVYLYLKDIQDTQVENRVKLRSRSFVLETLVAKENLNTVILNLYPGNKGYSLAFQQEYPPQNKTNEGRDDVFGSQGTMKNQNVEKEEHLLETVRWPYEIGDLLESINNEELPILYMKLFVTYAPNAFYSGCVIVEVRDYRQSFPLSACCDNYYVLLKPTTQTLLADAKILSLEQGFSNEDRVVLESNMVLATSGPLCLDPSPKVGRKALYSQYKRQMWNSSAIRRQMKKFSQVAINRKRKTDQFTHTYGLELSDFLYRTRQKQRVQPNTNDCSSSTSSKLPRKAADVIRPIRTPNLNLPNTLTPPSNVNVEEFAKAYERPRETKDCMPQLIEEYVLETDRGCGRVYHIKLSIYQRPANSEYLGELYVDRDYEKDSRNGEACQFSLGTRAHANRYIQQFTEIFTEEGRKSVKITHIVPGQAPKVSCTTGMIEHRQQQQQQQNPINVSGSANVSLNQPPNSKISANATLAATNTAPQPQILPTTTGTIIGIANIQTSQTQAIQLQKPTMFNTCDSGSNKTLQTANLQQISAATHTNVIQDIHGVQPQAHLSIANGSLVVVQDQPGGNITGVATITPQQHQQFQQVAAAVAAQQQQQQSNLAGIGNITTTNPANTQTGITTNVRNASLPVLAKLQTGPQGQLINKTATIHSNPEINALMTSIINSANQIQQQQANNAQTSKTNNNAAIISLLNSAPAAMTNSTVMSATVVNPSVSPQQTQLVTNVSPDNTTVLPQQQSPHQQAILPKPTILNHQQAAALSQNLLQGTIRKINVHNVMNSTQLANIQQQQQELIQQQQQQQQSPQSGPQQLSVRVTMSALANQLSSPPAVMSSSPVNPQTYNFAQMKPTGQQQIILSNTPTSSPNNRMLSQQSMRRDSLTAPSPGSDSNASNASSSNMGSSTSFAIGPGGFSTFLATSPTASILSDGGAGNSLSNQSASALMERLTNNSSAMSQQSINSPLGPVPSPHSTSSTHFMAPSPKSASGGSSNLNQSQQHIQVSSPVSISPLSSPPPALIQQPQTTHQNTPQHHHQATTLNLQGINLSSLQGAMATFPGLQNVQVQIPGLAQPISLSLTGTGGANTHQSTGLLVSVPVTSSNQVNQLHTVSSAMPVSNVIGQTSQTVVLTTASQPGQAGSMLSLPLAQLVAASNVKNLNQQHQQIRTGSTIHHSNNLTAAALGLNLNLGTIQSHQTLQQQGQQRPRGVSTVVTSPISTKPLMARGIMTPQRNIVASNNSQQMKTTTPLTVSYNATVNNAPILLTSQKLQLQLQKQAQLQHEQQNLKLGNAGSTQAVVVTPQSSMSPSFSNQPSLTTSHIGLEGLASNDGTLLSNNSNSMTNAVTLAIQKKNRRRSTASDLNK